MLKLLERFSGRRTKSAPCASRRLDIHRFSELARTAKSSEEYLEVGKQALAQEDYALANLAFRAINEFTRFADEARPLLARSRFHLALQAAEADTARGRKHATGFVEILRTLEQASKGIVDDQERSAIRQHTADIARQYINLRYKPEMKQKSWDRLFLLLDALERATDDVEERAWARQQLSRVAVNLAGRKLAELKDERKALIKNLSRRLT